MFHFTTGISASTGRPFSPPIAFCVIPRLNPGKTEKHFIRQGKCHKCSQWIAVEGIKDMESKVNIFSFLFFSESHLLIICFLFISRLKNYIGTVIFAFIIFLLLCISFFSFFFSIQRASCLHFTILNQVETCSCLPSRLNTCWRM